MTSPLTAALLPCLASWLAISPLSAAPSVQGGPPAQTATARGVVFEDRDFDGVRGEREPGVAGIRVSNGREIVRTDEDGAYAIPVDDDDIVFVIKPRGWQTAIDSNGLWRGYYVHKPAGSPKTLRFPGVAPTGPLPESIDFALTRNDEPDAFDMLVFGDPQPRDIREVDYCAHDVFDRLDPEEARLGIALGDIAFDDLDTLEPLNEAIGRIGLPFFFVYGNHDMNFHVEHDDLADETWERIYGPTNYSFDFGSTHFVVLDNVLYRPAELEEDGSRGPGGYIGYFDEEALTFLRVDLAEVPTEQRVVVCFHIHLDDRDINRDEFLACLEGHPNSFSMSAHTHVHRWLFFGEERADPAARPPHVHLNHGTVSGSWFCGAPQDNGVPHTTMRDGTPNGWGMLRFSADGSWRHDLYGAGMPRSEQMRIMAPDEVLATEAGEVVVNVFNGSERTRVEMRVPEAGDGWQRLERVERRDPSYVDAFEREAQVKAAFDAKGEPMPWRTLPRPQNCTHLWAGSLPQNLPVGACRIEIRATDMWGRVVTGERTIRVQRVW
jgi:hypothetical protein